MLSKIISRWFLDKNEKLFFKNSVTKFKQNNFNSIIVIQTPSDHYYLSLFTLLLNNIKKSNPNVSFAGVYPNTYILKDGNKSNWLKDSLILIDQYFIRKKWEKLYKSVGINFYLKNKNVSFFDRIFFILKAVKFFLKLKSKKDLFDLKIDEIQVGDLIYDTFLRYETKSTVDIKNRSLIKYLYSAFCLYKSFNLYTKKYKIKDYYSSYSTYIQHGIPVRIFLSKLVTVYTSGNLQQKFKKLSINDHFHTSNHSNYKSQFLLLSEKENKIEQGMNFLKQKFSGQISLSNSYMKVNVFNNNLNQNLKTDDFEGVLFLHDFFDSPHIYNEMLFYDFYEWTNFTLDLISLNNLKVAVKPHPNQIKESINIINSLKKKYNNVKWLDSSISNKQLFESNIKFGISLYGTVLHELAFFGKIAISAGDNPHNSFDFVLKPKSINEYKNMILNYYLYNLPDNSLNQVAIFYYMHNIFNKEPLDFDFSSLDKYNVFNTTSNVLPYLLNYLKGE